MAKAKQSNKKEEITITRIFNASSELVWKAWTEPEHIMRWWGPKGFTSPVCLIDLRVGGEYLCAMRSPEGEDIWSKGVYREVIAPERLVMTNSFADENGKVVSASYYGMSPDWPIELLITVTFGEDSGKTKQTLRHSGIASISAKDRTDMIQGWNESFDKLADYLTKVPLNKYDLVNNKII